METTDTVFLSVWLRPGPRERLRGSVLPSLQPAAAVSAPSPRGHVTRRQRLSCLPGRRPIAESAPACCAAAPLRPSAARRSRRERRFELHRLARDRVREREPGRVQELPLEPEAPRRRRRGRRRRAGRSPRGGRGSGACGRSRGGRAAARGSARSSLDLEVRHRVARRVRVERLPGRLARGRARSAPRSCRAASAVARGRARGTRARAAWRRTSRAAGRTPPPSGRRRAGRTCRRSSRWTMPGRSGSSPPVCPQPRAPCDERPAGVARAGMDDEARGLVDDQQVLVLVGDPQVERLRDERLRRSRQARARPASPPRAGSTSPRAVPSTSTLAGREQPLGRGPRADLRRAPARKRSSRIPAGVRRDADADQRRAPRGCSVGEQQRREQDRRRRRR